MHCTVIRQQAGETLNSLQFAARVKQVANNSMKSVETAQVRALKAQLKQLKGKAL